MQEVEQYKQEFQNKVYKFCQDKVCKLCGKPLPWLFKHKVYETRNTHKECRLKSEYENVDFAEFNSEEMTNLWIDIAFADMGKHRKGFFENYYAYGFSLYTVLYKNLPVSKIDDFLKVSPYLSRLLEKSTCHAVMISNMKWIETLTCVYQIDRKIEAKDVILELRKGGYHKGFAGVKTFETNLGK